MNGALVWSKAGASRAELLVIISQSDAAKVTLQGKMLVIMVYEAMLRRGPNPLTFDHWVKSFRTMSGYTSLVKAIRTSGTYAARF